MCTGVEVAALALAVAGTATSTYTTIQAGNTRKKAEQMKARQANIAAARERTQQIREARIKRAGIQQAAINQGAADSSSAITGASGVLSQAYGNNQYITDQAMQGEAISNLNQKAENQLGNAAIGQGVAQLGGTIFGNKDEITDIFKPSKLPIGTHGYEAFS